MKLVKFILGIVVVIAVIGFAAIAVIDIPVNQQPVVKEISAHDVIQN